MKTENKEILWDDVSLKHRHMINYYWEYGDFEYLESKHSYNQEFNLWSLGQNPHTYQNMIWYRKHREYQKVRSLWRNSYTLDWLHLQLGNKCIWCGRGNEEKELEIDHVLAVIRLGKKKNNVSETLKDFLSNEPLRLLCIDCHKVSHALRV